MSTITSYAAEAKENALLHWEFMKMKLIERMAYRFDFFTSFFAYFLWQFVGPAFVLVMFYAGGVFPGWTIAQVVVLQGVFIIVKGFSFMLLFGIVWNTKLRVSGGTFDMLLIRPRSTLWLLIMDSFDSEDMGQFLGGIVVTAIGIWMNGGVHGSIVLFALLLPIGVLFFFALALLFSAITIKFIQTDRVYEFTTIIGIFAGYPRTLYNQGLSLAFSTVLPLLIIAHYPAAALLGQPLEGLLLAVGSTILFFICSIVVWHWALRSYASAGG